MAGTLSATIAAGAAANPALTGNSLLAAEVLEKYAAAAGLTGTGALDAASALPRYGRNAPLTGSGELVCSPKQIYQWITNLLGGGSLGGTGTGKFDRTASLNGGGTLSATAEKDTFTPITVLHPTTVDFGGSATVSVTFSGYDPQENDVIAFWTSHDANTRNMTGNPAGWAKVTGSPGISANGDVKSDENVMGFVYHLVTASEESANTTTYSATNLWDGTTTIRNVLAAVIRNVDPATPIDKAAGFFHSTGASPHLLVPTGGITPTYNDSQVVTGIASNGAETYTTPAGWTVQVSAANALRRALFSRNTPTSAGVAVPAQNITVSATNEYAAICVVFKVAP